MIEDTNEIIDNKCIQRIISNKIVRYFSEDTSTKIAIITAVITLGSFFIKFLGYMRLKGFLSVYSIAVESIEQTSSNVFFEFLVNAFVFVGLVIPVAFFYIVIDLLRRKRNLKKFIYSRENVKFGYRIKRLLLDTFKLIPLFFIVLLFVEVINYLLYVYLAPTKVFSFSTAIEWLIMLFVLSIIEIITAIIIIVVDSMKRRVTLKNSKKVVESKNEKEKQAEEMAKNLINSEKNMLFDILTSSLVIMIFIYSGGAYLSGNLDAKQKKSYSIVEDKYVIIFQNSEYYWTISASEYNNTLTIDTAKQKIIGVEGVETTKKNFNEINIVYN